MSNFAPKRTDYTSGDRRWLRDPLKAETHGVTVTNADTADDANGFVKSGSLITGQGLVLNDFVIQASEKHLISVVHSGTVDRRYLPTALTLVQEEAFPSIRFINGTVPTA